jgi:hypothetical protein
MTHSRAYRAGAALFVVLAAAACTDRSPTGPQASPPGDGPGGREGPATTIAMLTCTASVQGGDVSCAPASAELGAASGLMIGGQGINVQLTSSNVNYNPGTGSFTFDATLQNLIEQPLGTTDGTTLDPTGIRIWFYTGPTVTSGTGVVAVIPDGFAVFTAPAQPYYNYPYVLDDNEVSPAEAWSFVVPPTALTFTFTVFVDAPVEYPDGYITLDGQLPEYDYGALHPTAPHALTAVVKNAFGTTIPGTVTFGTTDPLCATVSPTGTVTGVRAATCSITATSGIYAGEMVFDVTGMTRTWNGSVSTDWSVGGNWDLGVAPAAVDSVTIPFGTPNYPALVAATSIGGVTVADAATLSLGAFDLTAGANVATGYTAGSGIVGTTGVLQLAGTGETVLGRVPSLRVTGTYELAGDLHVLAPGRVLAGNLRNVSYLMKVVSQ